MNEKEKEAVARAADRLTLMAIGLRNGDFMSATDIASALDDRADQLLGLLKLPESPESPPSFAKATEGKEKRGLVGKRVSDTAALAWGMADRLEVLCQARKIKDGVWHLEGRSRGRLYIDATVFGGKWRTVRYMKFLRNGMVSMAMRHRRGISRAEKK